MNTGLLEEEYARQDWLDNLDEEMEQEIDDGRLDALVDMEDGNGHARLRNSSSGPPRRSDSVRRRNSLTTASRDPSAATSGGVSGWPMSTTMRLPSRRRDSRNSSATRSA